MCEILTGLLQDLQSLVDNAEAAPCGRYIDLSEPVRLEIVEVRNLVRDRIHGRDPRVVQLAMLDEALGRLLQHSGRSYEPGTAPFSNVTFPTPPRVESVHPWPDVLALTRAVALAVGLAVPLSVAPAFAQETVSPNYAGTTPTYIGLTPEDVGVLDRPRPEYDAKGIPLGGFRLFPTVGITANYDDNVYRQPEAQSDYYFEETPELRLQSQWGRHFLEFYAGADNLNYDKNTSLNLTDWTTGTDGRLDISRAATVTAGGYYGEYHEALDSPNTLGFQESPNRYNKGHAEISGVYLPDRLGFGIGGSADRYDWHNTPILGGGELYNSDRNESEYQAYARTFYEFSPGYSAYIKGLYDDRDFDHYFDRSGIHRSSNGYRIDTGLDAQISHLLSGELYVGYLEQLFKKDVPIPLKNISGLDFGAAVNWYADPLVTVHLNASRTISDTTIDGVSAIDNKAVTLSADYEFRRNIIVKALVGYTNAVFPGTNRSDDYPNAGVTLSYLIDEHVSLDASYNYSRRSSNVPDINFNDDLVSVGLNLHI